MSQVDAKLVAQLVREMAAKQLDSAVAALPPDPLQRLGIFIEATRVVDYQSVVQHVAPEDKRLSFPDFEILKSGWNIVAGECLSKVSQEGAFPYMESTQETREFAILLLHQFGRSILLQRVADMVQHGFLSVEPTSTGYRFISLPGITSQHLDNMEFYQLRNFSNYIKTFSPDSYKGWKISEHDESSDVGDEPGAHLSHKRELLKNRLIEDIDALMLPLIRPQDLPCGTVMAYNSTSEINDHFLALALEYIDECRTDIGIHSQSKLADTNGSDLSTIVTAITSFHMQHVRYSLLAMKHHKNILFPQSLTIWTSESRLTEEIADWSGMPLERVRAGMQAITLKATEAAYLRGEKAPQIPLLVSFENDVVLRPISSIDRNPFIATTKMLTLRKPDISYALSLPKEEMLRSELYSAFQGKRYVCIAGNINLREGSTTLTDIDAAILDRTSGCLALFQLKWQDFYTNDVRSLRSRASNLTRDLDEWAEKVCRWLEGKTSDDIGRAIRTSPVRDGSVSSVLLFALSRSAARMDGYGFSTKHPLLAVSNWPQFMRVRRELGPIPLVFSKMHAVFRAETRETLNTHPFPYECKIEETILRFEDFWYRVEDKATENNVEKDPATPSASTHSSPPSTDPHC